MGRNAKRRRSQRRCRKENTATIATTTRTRQHADALVYDCVAARSRGAPDEAFVVAAITSHAATYLGEPIDPGVAPHLKPGGVPGCPT